LPAGGVAVFEVDTPDQLRRKRSVLTRASVKMPDRLEPHPNAWVTRIATATV